MYSMALQAILLIFLLATLITPTASALPFSPQNFKDLKSAVGQCVRSLTFETPNKVIDMRGDPSPTNMDKMEESPAQMSDIEEEPAATPMSDCVRRVLNYDQPSVVFITGAAGGIGAGCARLFAEKGWSVVVADVDIEAIRATMYTLATTQPKQRHLAFPIDVTREDSVMDAVDTVMREFGIIDAAINCAGIEGDRGLLHDITEETFDNVFAVNVKGVFLSMKHQLRAMLNSKRDGLTHAIVNIASSAGISPFPEFSSYAASKSAVIGFTKTAAMEYIGLGIRINAIAPATISTPMVQRFQDRWPEWQAQTNAGYGIGRIGTVEEVAEAAYFLVCDRCDFIVGHVLEMTGGFGAPKFTSCKL